MSTEATARTFFSSPFFAVVGASSNPAKFGHKGDASGDPVWISHVEPTSAQTPTRGCS